MTSQTSLHDLARTHLPADMAARWLTLLRPGAGLAKAEPGEPLAGRLGGAPELPEGEEWPVWEGQGPLAFVARVDCAALPVHVLDIPLPADGTLSFFYFDGQIDDGEAFVAPDEPETWAGARVIYAPAGAKVTERPTPAGLEAYPEVPLTARLEPTAPDIWHPVVERTVGVDPRGEGWPSAFTDALYDHSAGPGHRVGGHADPVQNPVEFEVAHGVLGKDVRWDDPRVAEEAERWVLLAQFDTDDDADMMWGDCGALYWLIRPQDLAERRFDRAMCTMQCC
ncbi:YwqG family protein [Streptomyces sp. TLI_146]|uniref:YwqG family protein n=1 Tax=Streptomyces sp. TLI_146 TaxID=1938858 RepID=UPI000C708D44|nr:YwqG family protein [Streptomyces sp. TLI_146]